MLSDLPIYSPKRAFPFLRTEIPLDPQIIASVFSFKYSKSELLEKNFKGLFAKMPWLMKSNQMIKGLQMSALSFFSPYGFTLT